MYENEETDYKINRKTILLNNNRDCFNDGQKGISFNVEIIKQNNNNTDEQNQQENLSLPVLISMQIGKLAQEKSSFSLESQKGKKQNRPRFIMILLDRSESMLREDRLINAQNSIITLVKGLEGQDSIGLISFGGSNELILQFTKVNCQKEEYIKKQIMSVKATGQTNIVAALKRASDYIQQYQSQYDHELKNTYTILLLSDGYDNHSEKNAMLFIRENLKNTRMNFTINTFGYGSEHDARLLSSIAQYGGGSFYYIKESKNLLYNFKECCQGFEDIIAENIEVEVQIQESGIKDRKSCLSLENLPPNAKSLDKNQFTIYYKYGQQSLQNYILFFINLTKKDNNWSELSNSHIIQNPQNQSDNSILLPNEEKTIVKQKLELRMREFDQRDLIRDHFNELSIGQNSDFIQKTIGKVRIKYCLIGQNPIYQLEKDIVILIDPNTHQIIFPNQNQENNEQILKHEFTQAMKKAIEAFNCDQHSRAVQIFQGIESYIKQFQQDNNDSKFSQDLLTSAQYYKNVYEKNQNIAINEANLLIMEEVTYHDNNTSKKRRLQIQRAKNNEEIFEEEFSMTSNQISQNIQNDNITCQEEIVNDTPFVNGNNLDGEKSTINKSLQQSQLKKSKNLNVDDIEQFE